MGATWAAQLPRATIPMRDTPKPLTIVVPYYDNAVFFGRQLSNWFCRAREFDPHVRVIVVDDGSPEYPAAEVVWPLPVRGLNRFQLFRIEVDVPWNWLAARNIGLWHAPEGWVLMTDMDHVIPEPTLRSIVYGEHDPTVMYAFSRCEHDGRPIHPHSASFLLTRSLFWQIGGYDEALSGHYGSDGDWRRRAAQHCRIEVLPERLVRHETVDDASTRRYPRKLPTDIAAVRRIVAARGANWRPKTLTFPYHEVTC